ncbi:hypothetical protein TREMEDRAFT_60734 [Tremella mesenterica DSM 1558]|uniref:uncharacterized protein n=1 Tax=Tremella mesenterica (strain ATCC 24925 / CBS 8224 / DSM 1558 / NBRC 9311 / NRRL Y-6157 / RJB 2259-6 / UBC 559-6) TaxID=578456 RepID=UPI0003F48F68|nr:uncharacterized protein TREMEDRAFT_60734 [Tremella mesenterica DSM 1558]EIW71817.1 hypothetical protein TREMEDRAFT_60734 [Tremella mesenterica DSM 1558]
MSFLPAYTLDPDHSTFLLAQDARAAYSLATWSYNPDEDPETSLGWRRVELQDYLVNGQGTQSISDQLERLDTLLPQMSRLRHNAVSVLDIAMLSPPVHDGLQLSEWRFTTDSERKRRRIYHTAPWKTFLEDQKILRTILQDQQRMAELVPHESLLSEAVKTLSMTAGDVVTKWIDGDGDFPDAGIEEMSNAINGLGEILDNVGEMTEGNLVSLIEVGKMMLASATPVNIALSKLMVVEVSSIASEE